MLEVLTHIVHPVIVGVAPPKYLGVFQVLKGRLGIKDCPGHEPLETVHLRKEVVAQLLRQGIKTLYHAGIANPTSLFNKVQLHVNRDPMEGEF